MGKRCSRTYLALTNHDKGNPIDYIQGKIVFKKSYLMKLFWEALMKSPGN
jgi:hypothetical protein